MMTSEQVLIPFAGLRRVLGDEKEGGLLNRLLQSGRLTPPDVEGRVDLLIVVPAYFAELRATLTEGSATAAAERARAARAEAQELRLAVSLREMIHVEDAETAVEQLAGAIVTELTGLPARVTRDLSVRRQIEDIVRKAQQAISDDLAEQR